MALGGSIEGLSAQKYYDGSVAEAFDWNLLADFGGSIATATLSLFNHLRVDSGGFKRNNDGLSSYDNNEWILVDLRIANALRRAGDTTDADGYLGQVVDKAAVNFFLLPELYNDTAADGAIGKYFGSIPMVGYGAGAYLMTILDRSGQWEPNDCGDGNAQERRRLHAARARRQRRRRRHLGRRRQRRQHGGGGGDGGGRRRRQRALSRRPACATSAGARARRAARWRSWRCRGCSWRSRLCGTGARASERARASDRRRASTCAACASASAAWSRSTAPSSRRAPGEILGLCGENGAGKSTLLKILAGVWPHGSFDGELRARRRAAAPRARRRRRARPASPSCTRS